MEPVSQHCVGPVQPKPPHWLHFSAQPPAAVLLTVCVLAATVVVLLVILTVAEVAVLAEVATVVAGGVLEDVVVSVAMIAWDVVLVRPWHWGRVPSGLGSLPTHW